MVWGVGEKTALVTAQVLGYTLSKLIGIRVVAEMTPARRAAAILVLIAMAEAALVLFAVAPSPLHVVCLFLNGLPLGMVFGMVLGFLEGRRLTEALTAGALRQLHPGRRRDEIGRDLAAPDRRDPSAGCPPWPA